MASIKIKELADELREGDDDAVVGGAALDNLMVCEDFVSRVVMAFPEAAPARGRAPTHTRKTQLHTHDTKNTLRCSQVPQELQSVRSKVLLPFSQHRCKRSKRSQHGHVPMQQPMMERQRTLPITTTTIGHMPPICDPETQ